MVPVFENVGKLVDRRLVENVEKCDLFSDFQYGFRSSRSTANLMTNGLLISLGLLEA